jgi:hypothetical protein
MISCLMAVHGSENIAIITLLCSGPINIMISGPVTVPNAHQPEYSNSHGQAIGYWLLAIGYWLLAIGYWLLAILAIGATTAMVGCI